MSKGDSIREMAIKPWKMKLYMLKNLPMGFLAGLKVVRVDKQLAQVNVPYKYLNKNPFGSIYFAVLSMAAELATGLLALAAVKDESIPISLLVLDIGASFEKKAKGRIVFTCEDGEAIKQAVEQTVISKQEQTVLAKSIGRNGEGEVVCHFQLTWTFKLKN